MTEKKDWSNWSIYDKTEKKSKDRSIWYPIKGY